jgi:hypothetical protein
VKPLVVKAEEWADAEFHSPTSAAPASPDVSSFPEALKHIQAGELKQLGNLFKKSFPYSAGGNLDDDQNLVLMR